MSHVPYRTGITTLFRYLKLICVLIVKFRSKIAEVWSPEQMASLDALVGICEVIITFPNPRPYDE